MVRPFFGPSAAVCTECRGTAFKKYSLLYEEQRSTGTAKSGTVGVGFTSGGQIGVGGAKTNTKSIQITDLGRRVSPPDRRAIMHPYVNAYGAIAIGSAVVVWSGFGLVAGSIAFTATGLILVIVNSEQFAPGTSPEVSTAVFGLGEKVPLSPVRSRVDSIGVRNTAECVADTEQIKCYGVECTTNHCSVG